MESQPLRILIVDLNNFARYPTLAVGYLVAALRGAGHEVRVLSPLAHGVPAVEREHVETTHDQITRRIQFSTRPGVERVRDRLYALWAWSNRRPHPRVLNETKKALDEPTDVVLLSAYVDHFVLCSEIARIARARDVPVLLGGPVFNLEEVSREWLGIPGLTAIYGGEVDHLLPELVRDLVEGNDLTRHPGVALPDGRAGMPAPPLQPLDGLPIPDFTDFPWQLYPHPVIPAMTGRGCSWAACRFCGDVVSANGRTFRSRPVDEVFRELEVQAERHGSRDFVFLDIKLNSDPGVWESLLTSFQDRLPGARWIGALHVAQKGPNGLSREELLAAREAGMTRATFGLESGSQRVLDAMDKGTDLDDVSRFLRHAHEAGISMRTTVMQGYPGEHAEDVARTETFLAAHEPFLDRVRLTRFKPLPGTRLHRQYLRDPASLPGLERVRWDMRFSRATYDYRPARTRSYRRAKARLLRRVHRINRKPLRLSARSFDGLM